MAHNVKVENGWEEVAQEMAKYQQVMAKASFVSKQQFLQNYGSVPGDIWGKDAPLQKPPDPLDFDKAKPFIRAVIERMLDLLASEENWIKNTEAQTAAGSPTSPMSEDAEAWCLIGAQKRALHDLALTDVNHDATVEKQRQRVMAAIDRFLRTQLSTVTDGKHHSMPSWNDQASTEFEDVRLWLKSLLTELS